LFVVSNVVVAVYRAAPSGSRRAAADSEQIDSLPNALTSRAPADSRPARIWPEDSCSPMIFWKPPLPSGATGLVGSTITLFCTVISISFVGSGRTQPDRQIGDWSSPESGGSPDRKRTRASDGAIA
jgi:hypothetical protein